MNFTSSLFLFSFLPVFLVVYYLMPSNVLKNITILIASLYFYSFGEPLFIYAMVFSIIVNFILSKYIHKSFNNEKLKKILLIVDIVFNLSLLVIFKYTDFIIATINNIFSVNLALKNIPLPIGISFFTFQILSYVIDVYMDNAQNDSLYYQKNILNFALYISMFPQLIAGPIVRYSDISKEIKHRKFNINQINYGLKRFIYGLSKKILIANSMAIVADTAFSMDPKDAGSAMLILGAISYTLQIYFDFSGYSDMAIGIGNMLGFVFPENFNKPYLAVSITDFWRRWHMTLSSWFKDYVYIPLGGSKKGLRRTIINLFVVWFLTGLWHGAKWTFVLWGLLYFAFAAFEKHYKNQHDGKTIDKNIPYIASRFYTMFVVVILWVIFRSNSIKDAFNYIFNMFAFTNPGLVNSQALFYIKDFFLFYVMAFLCSTHFFTSIKNIFFGKEDTKAFTLINNIYLVFLLVICTFYVIKQGYNPFIYFNF